VSFFASLSTPASSEEIIVMQIIYVGPSDGVELEGVAGVVDRGVAVDVPADLAGRAPVARLAVAMNELYAATAALDHPLCASLRLEIIELDPGVGLLAQDVWQVAPAVKASKKDEVTS